MKNRRKTALFLAFVLLLSTLLIAFSFAGQAMHECSGEDCPTCRMIFSLMDLMRESVLLLLCAFLLFESTIRCRGYYQNQRGSEAFPTLVALRVKLLD